MIAYVHTNIFSSPAKVLVNAVNTVGVMGKGIAKEFKTVYPEMFNNYVHLCESGELKIGKLYLYKTNHKWVLNFPTKTTWKAKSLPEYIELGLKSLVESYSHYGITSIAFPQLGCGNGELNWESDIKPLMEKYLARLPIDIFIHIYKGTDAPAEHQNIESMREWLRSEPQTLAFSEFWQDLSQTIANGLNLKCWSSDETYTVMMEPDRSAILINPPKTFVGKFKQFVANMTSKLGYHLLNGSQILIPKESLLELWQSVRTHGFCYPAMMPCGLDILASYIQPLLARLPYLKSVEMSIRSATTQEQRMSALQLFSAILTPHYTQESAPLRAMQM